MPFKFEVPKIPSPPEARPGQKSCAPPEDATPNNNFPPPEREVNRRECESAPGYDWRTDPYYNEEAIRERLKAAKAKVLPIRINNTKEDQR